MLVLTGSVLHHLNIMEPPFVSCFACCRERGSQPRSQLIAPGLFQGLLLFA